MPVTRDRDGGGRQPASEQPLRLRPGLPVSQDGPGHCQADSVSLRLRRLVLTVGPWRQKHYRRAVTLAQPAAPQAPSQDLTRTFKLARGSNKHSIQSDTVRELKYYDSHKLKTVTILNCCDRAIESGSAGRSPYSDN